MRRRDAPPSSPTGKIAAQMSVAPGVEQVLELRGHRRLVADDRGVARSGRAAVGEDPLIVGQLPVELELPGRDRARLAHVVVHGHGQTGDDARRGPARRRPRPW